MANTQSRVQGMKQTPENPIQSDYRLGVVVVEVTLANGEIHIEDWPPDLAEDAREYAAETSHCSDVLETTFWNGSKNECCTFAKPNASGS